MTTRVNVSGRWSPIVIGILLIGVVVLGALLSGFLGADSDSLFYTAVGVVCLIAGAVLMIQPRWGTYLLVLTFPFIVLVPRGAYIPAFKLDEVLIIASLFAALVKEGLVKRSITLRLTRIDYVCWLMFMAGSVLPSIGVLLRGQTPDLLEIIALLKQYAIYRLILATLKNRKHLSLVIALLLYPSLLVSLIALLQMLDIGNVRFLLGKIYESQALLIYQGLGPYRATSTLGNWNALGGYATLNLLLSLQLMRNKESFKPSWAVPVFFGANLVSLMLSGSSSSIFGFLAGVVVGARSYRLRRRYIAYIPLILVIVVVGYMTVGQRVLQAQIERQVGDKITDLVTGKEYPTYGIPRSVVTRWLLARYLFELMARDRLALLLGFGSSPEAFALLPWGTAESGYFDMFFFYGPAFVVIYLVLLNFIRRKSRSIQSKSNMIGDLGFNIAKAVEIIVFTIGIMNIIHPYYSAAGVTHYFWIVVGSMVSLSYFSS